MKTRSYFLKDQSGTGEGLEICRKEFKAFKRFQATERRNDVVYFGESEECRLMSSLLRAATGVVVENFRKKPTQ